MTDPERRPRTTAGPPAGAVSARPDAGEADYPPIGDYAFLSDCHSAALVSRRGSIDWCAMPRIDGDSFFGRILDWCRAGYCSLAPVGDGWEVERDYVDGSLVLATCFTTPGGRVRLLDALAMHAGGRLEPHRQILRVVEGIEGEVEVEVRVVPRFDHGSTLPWIRHHGQGVLSAIGGDSALVVVSDLELEGEPGHAIVGRCTIAAGERRRLAVEYTEPHRIHPVLPERVTIEEIDRRLDATIGWWRRWSAQARGEAADDPRVLRSAAVVRGLVYAPTGAIAAAATTSLPEAIGAERNWDYRFSWIRDSDFALASLGKLGFDREANGFRRFMERTTAGSTTEIQPMYGVRGEHLLPEIELDFLEGYRGSRPVRLGNDAYRQVQFDAYGSLVELAWRSAERGQEPDPDYWSFLCDVVEEILRRWREPDRGIWEVRDGDHHFVHSKAMCWAVVDRGCRIAERCGLEAPVERWRRGADEIRAEIEEEGIDPERGTFRREYGDDDVDAALLLLPRVDFVAYDDPRMLATVDRIREDLGTDDGLIRRYRAEDGLPGDEGCFLACSFWLAECLALQGRRDEAREVFESAAALGNDLGLFSEEVGDEGELLGNFPQGLTHFSHITAAEALHRGQPSRQPEEDEGLTPEEEAAEEADDADPVEEGGEDDADVDAEGGT